MYLIQSGFKIKSASISRERQVGEFSHYTKYKPNFDKQ